MADIQLQAVQPQAGAGQTVSTERPSSSASLRLPLLATALLLLQYSGTLHSIFKSLGRLQGIPVTLVFLGVVAALLLAPATRLVRTAQAIQWTILAVFTATAAWTYLRGSLAIGRHAWLILAIAAALGAAGHLRREPGWIFAGAAVLILAVSRAQIAAHPFDEIFQPGRPIWNIRHAVERLLEGTWVYQYHYGLSLGYLPTLFLPYLPFGSLHIDLRWTSVSCMLALLAALYWQTRNIQSPATAWTAVMVLASPAVVYASLTAQVAVYWCYLLVFGIGLAKGKENTARTGLIFSILARQLAWPMALPWLVASWRKLKSMRPGGLESAALAVTAICMAISPRGFLWSVFVLASADANKGSAALPQPVSAIALTPLLPFARHSLLVLAAQVLLVFALAAVLHGSGLLQKAPLRACALVYAAFLSLNVLVYDYYWVDVIVLALAAVLFERPCLNPPGSAAEEDSSTSETASRTNASLQTLARSTARNRSR